MQCSLPNIPRPLLSSLTKWEPCRVPEEQNLRLSTYGKESMV